jgi:hypothetical protein
MNYKVEGLPTREMKPLTVKQREEHRINVRKYGVLLEEPLPTGCSLRDPRTMNLVYRSMN